MDDLEDNNIDGSSSDNASLTESRNSSNQTPSTSNSIPNTSLNSPHGSVPGSGNNTRTAAPIRRTKFTGKSKINIEFIHNRSKRQSTFSKRKTGIMKKAYELAELTGAEVLLMIASDTNHVYTYGTTKMKPVFESEKGKMLIEACLNNNPSPQPPPQPSPPEQPPGGLANQNTEYHESANKNLVLSTNQNTDQSFPNTLPINNNNIGKNQQIFFCHPQVLIASPSSQAQHSTSILQQQQCISNATISHDASKNSMTNSKINNIPVSITIPTHQIPNNSINSLNPNASSTALQFPLNIFANPDNSHEDNTVLRIKRPKSK